MVKKRSRAILLEALEILLFSLVLSWGLRSTVVEAAYIPSPSMLPTIQVQDRVVIDKLYYKVSGIQRGDIIVFHPPKNLDPSGNYWIKRVIALPGDQVLIKDGKVLVNNRQLSEPYTMEAPNYTFGPLVIPKDSYFLLGDNRNDSLDSHEWGVLPAKDVVGRALFRYWPLQRFGRLAK